MNRQWPPGTNTQWPPATAPTTPARYFENGHSIVRADKKKDTTINFRVDTALFLGIAEVGHLEQLSLSDTCRLLLREAIAARLLKP